MNELTRREFVKATAAIGMLAMCPTAALAAEKPKALKAPGKSALVKDQMLIPKSPDKYPQYPQVRYLVLKGTDREIGYSLAELATPVSFPAPSHSWITRPTMPVPGVASLAPGLALTPSGVSVVAIRFCGGFTGSATSRTGSAKAVTEVRPMKSTTNSKRKFTREDIFT
ncbi:MAG: hypothetical protein FJ134_00645 [Deltaproteobacteria bacterium]|nr:hypothetical protein [Deltaproteobacteria bacterium]